MYFNLFVKYLTRILLASPVFKLNIYVNMPQLVPFYFINEVTFTFAIIAITVYLLSKYILPRFVRLFLSRTFISKLHASPENK